MVLKILVVPADYWRNPKVCRAFFDELARELGIDRFDPKSWYGVRSVQVLSKKVKTLVLFFLF